MSISKRDFLKSALQVTGFGTLCYFAGKETFFMDNQGQSNKTQRIDQVKQDAHRVSKLMDEYGIQNQEKAISLYNKICTETASYSSYGASLTCLTNSALQTWHPGAKNSFRGYLGVKVASMITPITAQPLARKFGDSIQKSPLCAIDTLKNEYGMSDQNARKFKNRYEKTLHDATRTSAGAVVILQTLFGMPTSVINNTHNVLDKP